MIVVTVQYTDWPETSSNNYNGGTSVVFQILSEAKSFAEIESRANQYQQDKMASLCRVYLNGSMVQAWLNGVNVTP